MANLINWFEIPAADIHRASKFYSTILDKNIPVQNFGGLTMAMLPMGAQDEVTGALVQHEGYTPSDTDGALLYLNGNPDLTTILERIEGAGGKILRPKSQISPEVGYMALFTDTEGNRMALHSNG